MSGRGIRCAPSIPEIRRAGLEVAPCQACDGDGCSHCRGMGICLTSEPPVRRGPWSRLAVQLPRSSSARETARALFAIFDMHPVDDPPTTAQTVLTLVAVVL